MRHLDLISHLMDRHMHPFVRIALGSLGLLLAACTPTLQIASPPAIDPQTPVLAAEQADRFWWQLRFRLIWPEAEEPDFSRHLLIAEQLLLPVIAEYEEEMPLWRFHRRAGRDKAGHQFSLIFYADETTATQLNTAVTANPLTLWLEDRKMIEKTRFGQRSTRELGRLEDTSDKNWPEEIQRSWPWFSMGASQSWLLLVQQLSRESELGDETDYPGLLAHYREVDARLNLQWRDYGQHAYLHHLNAIFGYQPVRVRTRELMRF